MGQVLEWNESGHLRLTRQPGPADAAECAHGDQHVPSPDPGSPPSAEDIGITVLSEGIEACLAPDLAQGYSDYWMTPFQLPEWRLAWNQAIGASGKVKPVTVILTLQQRKVAILPLALQETAGIRVLTWHAADQSDYGAPIVARDQLDFFCSLDGRSLLRRVARATGGADLVHLPRQIASIAGRANPLVMQGSLGHHAGAHAINFPPGESWDEFLARSRSSSTRQLLRKKQRSLAKLGAVGFRVASTADEARAIAEHCLAAKSAQLARLGHYDPFALPQVRRFLIDYFSDAVGDTGWAVALTLDDRLIVSSIGFAQPGEWLLYQMAMDDNGFAHCSPGTQLLMHIMRHCIAGGVSRLDLAMGDESYKFEWCDEHQLLFNSSLALTPKGQLAHATGRLKSHILRYMVAHPMIQHAGKALKRQLHALNIRI